MKRSSLPACLSLVVLLSPAQAATRVDLVIDEPQPPRSVPWPITTGVPFPRGQLQAVDNCRLVDDTGAERPLQARIAATWDAERRNVRWLTIDFIAHPGRKYALEYGADVRAKPSESPLRIEQKDAIRVVTGALTVEFSKTGAAALGPIRIDLNGDGTIAADEVVANGAGEHYSVDHDGRRASSAGDTTDRRIVVEASGPIRACVRVDGYYTGADQKRTLAYRTRYHFFAGLGLIKVIDEFRIVGSTRGIRWRDVGFVLQLPARENRTVAVDASGEPGNQVLSIKPGKASVSTYQSTYRHYGNLDCQGGVAEIAADGEKLHKSVERVGEWMQMADERVAVTGSLRWLWQQFPKEWEATSEGLRLHLWSPRGGELDFGVDGIKRFFGEAGDKYLLDWRGVRFPRTPIERYFYYAGRSALERGEADGLGIRKHHEIYYHFAPAKQAEQGQEYGRLAALPPIALASGKWNCSTDVFGPLAARPSDAPDEAIVDRLFDLGRRVQDEFGDYGWWLFGAGPHYSYQWDAQTKRFFADPRRFEFHTYHKETQLWWCYLRSGERKFYEWALPSENHWTDVAVCHAPTTFRTEWRGGDKHEATQHWRPGDWAIDSTVHYLRHHDRGEAWLRGQAQFWASYHRTLETTSLAYYLTGDERFNEVIDYWRSYWGDLAGKTSASTDMPAWHREQAWYRPAADKGKTKTWAEMLRDYAPFQSGSRHQLTLLFNLSTLYEHTWDPKIAQVLREYADAFIDPKHPIGVWRSQDNRQPAKAEAPLLAHFWVPALWKYARASGDPRMPDVFRRYFDACLGADPFHEDVGVYSNVHIGYAYYFTRDPRHLRPAVRELDHLRPHAAPLARPEDINSRLYNPYAPCESFAAVPRLLWALQEAKQKGIDVPPPPAMRPQRAPIALDKPAGKPLDATLWGFDRTTSLQGPDGKPFAGFQVRSTKQYASAIQPFDRTLPGFAVYQHQVTIPAEAPAGWYVLTPRLELAVLDLRGSDGARCNASVPVALHGDAPWLWRLPAGTTEVRLESAAIKSIRLTAIDGKPVAIKVGANDIALSLRPEDAGRIIRIENPTSTAAWFRMAGIPPERCWLGSSEAVLRRDISREQTLASLPPPLSFRAEDAFVDGRFGKGILIAPGRTLELPDHQVVDGKPIRLFDTDQGTVEFWVKRLWDDRLATSPRVTFLTNGLIEAWSPWKLPLGEWAHVAVVWRPLKKGSNHTLVHVYVNGLDQAYYRSVNWEGYSSVPIGFSRSAKWLEKFISQTPVRGDGVAFVLDDLRVSSTPRYADLDVDFGPQHTFNPIRFTPPTGACQRDQHTLLLFRFDNDLKDDGGKVEGKLAEKKK